VLPEASTKTGSPKRLASQQIYKIKSIHFPGNSCQKEMSKGIHLSTDTKTNNAQRDKWEPEE
jgi:hypothetical protein